MSAADDHMEQVRASGVLGGFPSNRDADYTLYENRRRDASIEAETHGIWATKPKDESVENGGPIKVGKFEPTSEIRRRVEQMYEFEAMQCQEPEVSATTILHQCIDDIGERASVRDLPQERSMKRAVAAFNAIHGTTLTETQGWMFMALVKASRGAAGAHHLDDYIDFAAYGALAGESAEREAR